MTPISYEILSQALKYYQSKGFTYIDVPWTVPQAIDDITRPPEASPFVLKDGMHLVASGEQSFLSLIDTGALPKGKYVCLTPCFRDDPLYDDLRRPYFMKVELIDYSDQPDADQLMEVAWEFFLLHTPVVPLSMPDRSTDILHRFTGVELGSYGVRHHKGYCWAYGTGCAEPRLSSCKDIETRLQKWETT